MTVADLIAELQKLPPETTVTGRVFPNSAYCFDLTPVKSRELKVWRLENGSYTTEPSINDVARFRSTKILVIG